MHLHFGKYKTFLLVEIFLKLPCCKLVGHLDPHKIAQCDEGMHLVHALQLIVTLYGIVVDGLECGSVVWRGRPCAEIHCGVVARPFYLVDIKLKMMVSIAVMGVFHARSTFEKDEFFGVGIVSELDAFVCDLSSVGTHLHRYNSCLRLEFFESEYKSLGFGSDERLVFIFENEFGVLCAVLHLTLEYHAILRVTAHIINAFRKVGNLDIGVITRKLRESCLLPHAVEHYFVAVSAFDRLFEVFNIIKFNVLSLKLRATCLYLVIVQGSIHAVGGDIAAPPIYFATLAPPDMVVEAIRARRAVDGERTVLTHLTADVNIVGTHDDVFCSANGLHRHLEIGRGHIPRLR